MSLAHVGVAAGEGKGKAVTWANFTRAETDKYFRSYVDKGAFGKFFHVRNPTPIDQQEVIRMNRAALYSCTVFDVTSPVTINEDIKFSQASPACGPGHHCF